MNKAILISMLVLLITLIGCAKQPIEDDKICHLSNFENIIEEYDIESEHHCKYIFTQNKTSTVFRFPILQRECVEIVNNCKHLGGQIRVHEEYQSDYNITLTFREHRGGKEVFTNHAQCEFRI